MGTCGMCDGTGWMMRDFEQIVCSVCLRAGLVGEAEDIAVEDEADVDDGLQVDQIGEPDRP